MNSAKPFIGSGWAFPPEFTNGGANVEMVSNIEDIRQSLEILFGTRLNERIMNEDYGCSLQDFQFEGISSTMINRIRRLISEAILYHEARIKVNKINIGEDQAIEGLLNIQLDFTVPESNSRYNMVYPFYINEANQ